MKIFIGTVLSRKMDKTAVVGVTRVVVHPVYKKRVKRIKKYHVHDEDNVTKVGESVRFAASKPYSKTKRWKLVGLGKTEEKKTQANKPKTVSKQK